MGRRKGTGEELVDSWRRPFTAADRREERMHPEEGPSGVDGDGGVEAQWRRLAGLLVLELLL